MTAVTTTRTHSHNGSSVRLDRTCREHVRARVCVRHGERLHFERKPKEDLSERLAPSF